MRVVTIKGKEYKVAYNLKGLFTYEEMVGHPYKGEKTIDSYLLLYSMLIANNRDFAMEFDEFIEECDKDMDIYRTYLEVLNEESIRVSAYNDKKKATT